MIKHALLYSRVGRFLFSLSLFLNRIILCWELRMRRLHQARGGNRLFPWRNKEAGLDKKQTINIKIRGRKKCLQKLFRDIQYCTSTSRGAPKFCFTSTPTDWNYCHDCILNCLSLSCRIKRLINSEKINKKSLQMKVDPEDPDRLQTDSNNENKHPTLHRHWGGLTSHLSVQTDPGLGK